MTIRFRVKGVLHWSDLYRTESKPGDGVWLDDIMAHAEDWAKTRHYKRRGTWPPPVPAAVEVIVNGRRLYTMTIAVKHEPTFIVSTPEEITT